MDILGKKAVQQKGTGKIKRKVLSVFIVIVIIVIFFSFVAGGGVYALSLLIPLTYIINAKNTMSKKYVVKEVIISISASGTDRAIDIADCEYFKKKLCSVRYVIKNPNSIRLTYFGDNNATMVLSNTNKILNDGDNKIPMYVSKPETIELNINMGEYLKLSEYLGVTT